MSETADAVKTAREPACTWCGMALRPEVYERRRGVCERCARLLLAAGLSDEEIFGPPAAFRSLEPTPLHEASHLR
jgi:hypothetical protein